MFCLGCEFEHSVRAWDSDQHPLRTCTPQISGKYPENKYKMHTRDDAHNYFLWLDLYGPNPALNLVVHIFFSRFFLF